MHYLEAGQYTYLAGEINALYHEAAVKTGISDSVQNILYVLCERDGQCLQSEISKLTGISRQTINSAIRKLEKEEELRLQEIDRLECELKELKEFLSKKDVYSDPVKSREVQEKITEKENEIQEATARWEKAAGELEEFQNLY